MRTFFCICPPVPRVFCVHMLSHCSTSFLPILTIFTQLHVFSAHAHVFLHLRNCSTCFLHMEMLIDVLFGNFNIFYTFLSALFLFFFTNPGFGVDWNVIISVSPHLHIVGIFFFKRARIPAFAHVLHVFAANAHVFLRLRNCSMCFLQMEMFFSLLLVLSTYLNVFLHFCTLFIFFTDQRQSFFCSCQMCFCGCAPCTRIFCACASYSAFAQLLHTFSADGNVFLTVPCVSAKFNVFYTVTSV